MDDRELDAGFGVSPRLPLATRTTTALSPLVFLGRKLLAG
jgi:hypothetical protein